MKNKLVDIVCVCVVGALFGGIALWNLVQPNRPVISESEKRKLAAMPEFSVSSLADGSYFAGVSAFISDTFVERDRLVGLSRKMDTLKGFEYSVGGEESFVLLNPTSSDNRESERQEDENADAINALFEALLNPDSQPEEGPVPESEKEPVPETEPGSVPEQPGQDQNEAQGSDGQDPVPEENAQGTESSGTEAAETEPGPEQSASDGKEEPGTPAEEEPDSEAAEEPAAEEEPDSGSAREPAAEEEPGPVPEEPAEDPLKVRSLTLSKEEISLTVGTGTVLYAYADTADPAGAVVHWTNSDKSVATISINPNGGIDVKAVGAGSTLVTCSTDEFKVECRVTVSELTVGVDFTPPTNDENENADFLPDGLFIYGDAVYTQTGYSETNARWFAQTAAAYAQKFGCRVSVVVAPVSSMVIDNPNVKSKISDQGEILKKMKALCDASVNFVDTYSPMYEHRDEYLFFRTDHHWTQRGAYYAYTAFAESVGLTPTPLSFFDFQIRNDNYAGSMYNWTKNPKVLEFSDQIEAFYPTKQHTMTVTNVNGGTNVYNSSIVSVNKSYVTFIAGDNPYTVINVPDNPQDKNILVLKDSFGNAFVPFLCEHYGNIIVVDVRHTSMNIYDHLKDYGITDIVFVNNIQAANSYSWSKMYMRGIGVTLP